MEQIQENGLEQCLELSLVKYENKFDVKKMVKMPLDKIGIISAPVMEALLGGLKSGGSGLYMVNTHGGALSFSTIKDAFIGSIIKDGKTIQASLNPIHFNPMTLAFSLVSLNMLLKFDEVNLGIKRIINKLENKDNATIEWAYINMKNIIERYKVSEDKKKYIANTIETVNNYVDDLGKLYVEYKNSIKDSVSIEAIINNYRKYQYILYVLSLARYIQTVFYGDFSEKYLKTILDEYKKNEEESKAYYNLSKSMISDRYLTKRRICLTLVAKITNSNYILNRIAYKLFEYSRQIEDMNITKQFSSQIIKINNLYNKKFEFLVDKKSIYLK